MADRIKVGDKVIVDSDRNLTVDKIFIKGDITHLTGVDPTITGGGTIPFVAADHAATSLPQSIRVDTSFTDFGKIWPDRGTNKGYQVGGNISQPRNSATQTDVIERYPFAISSGSATDIAEMSQGARQNVGTTQSEDNLYYWSGAVDPGSSVPQDSAIYKLPFASSVPISQTAVPFEVHGVSHWHNSLYNGSMGVNVSKTHWYFAQGQRYAGSRSLNDPGSSNTIWDHTWGKFPFASDTSVTLAGDIQDVVTDRVWMNDTAGFNSPTDAITHSESSYAHPATANTAAPPLGNLDTRTMWKFPFASDTTVTIAIDNVINQPETGGQFVTDPRSVAADYKNGISPGGQNLQHGVASNGDKGHYLAYHNPSSDPEGSAPNGSTSTAFRRFGYSFPFATFVINSEVAEAYAPSQTIATHLGERNNLTNGNGSGFVTGGASGVPFNTSFTGIESISKYPFVSPAAPAQDVGELTTGKYNSSPGVD